MCTSPQASELGSESESEPRSRSGELDTLSDSPWPNGTLGFPDIAALEDTLQYLASLDRVELVSQERVEQSGLFVDMPQAALDHRARTSVSFRQGWVEVAQWLRGHLVDPLPGHQSQAQPLSRDQGSVVVKDQEQDQGEGQLQDTDHGTSQGPTTKQDIQLFIVSVGWSARFISLALASPRGGSIHPTGVVANEVEMQPTHRDPFSSQEATTTPSTNPSTITIASPEWAGTGRLTKSLTPLGTLSDNEPSAGDSEAVSPASRCLRRGETGSVSDPKLEPRHPSMDPIRAPGLPGRSGVRIASDKRREMERILARARPRAIPSSIHIRSHPHGRNDVHDLEGLPSKQDICVYMGDSTTDLEALLFVDVGIILGPEGSSLLKLLDQLFPTPTGFPAGADAGANKGNVDPLGGEQQLGRNEKRSWQKEGPTEAAVLTPQQWFDAGCPLSACTGWGWWRIPVNCQKHHRVLPIELEPTRQQGCAQPNGRKRIKVFIHAPTWTEALPVLKQLYTMAT